MIAAVAIEHLVTRIRSGTVGVSWLYCSYKSRNEQSLDALLASILQQLLQAESPQVVQVVGKLHQKHASQKTKPTVSELQESLEAALESLATTYIVIDALDECSAENDTRRKFLAILRALQAKSKLRLMVTSRHVPHIVEEFPDALRLEVRAQNEDVKKFIEGQLGRLPKCIQRDEELQHRVQTQIAGAIDGMYAPEFHYSLKFLLAYAEQVSPCPSVRGLVTRQTNQESGAIDPGCPIQWNADARRSL